MIDSYYVTNFMDYRFLQVFFPTRGILEYYNRATDCASRCRAPTIRSTCRLMAYGVPTASTSSLPAPKHAIHGRRDNCSATHATDPNETQIQYDLYQDSIQRWQRRYGGAHRWRVRKWDEQQLPQDLAGRQMDCLMCSARTASLCGPTASSTSSPPVEDGPRRLRANTRLMNSWHSWSPNGRWLVFSSKARSPYTQMYLTHIDENGNSSPAILIDNATASNRAVNIPEFVNINPDGIDKIEVHVADGANGLRAVASRIGKDNSSAYREYEESTSIKSHLPACIFCNGWNDAVGPTPARRRSR